MQAGIEQVLNKAFDEAKIQSSQPGTYGRFGVYWDVKDGRPIAVKATSEENKLLPRSDSTN